MTSFCLNFSGGAEVPHAAAEQRGGDGQTRRLFSSAFGSWFAECTKKYSTAIPSGRLPPEARAGYHSCVRTLGLDLGAKRIGLAISDASGTLARPLEVLHVAGGQAARTVAALVDALGRRGRRPGCHRRRAAAPARRHRRTLRRPSCWRSSRRCGGVVRQPIALQDERLTSVEAESRLALRDRDWRSRKKKLDAAAAAIILQDYLDERSGR